MKKTIIYTAFWLATAGIALTSCEDIFGGFLDKQPSNELTEEEVFSQWTTTREFHFDTYNFLRHGACRINNSWMDAATDLAETSYASGGTRTSFNIGNYYASGAATELHEPCRCFRKSDGGRDRRNDRQSAHLSGQLHR